MFTIRRSLLKNFNPRSRTGSDYAEETIYNSETHFNPRSRTGSDWRMSWKRYFPGWISIHAPAQGATPFQNTPALGRGISIHAPAQGATDVTR